MTKTKQEGRVLRTSVNVFSEEYGFQSYPPGMPEELMRPGDADLITNPKCWVDPSDEEEETLSVEVLAAAAATAAIRTEYAQADQEEDIVDDEFTSMSVPQLREYAQENDVDLGGATRKGDILKVLRGDAG